MLRFFMDRSNSTKICSNSAVDWLLDPVLCRQRKADLKGASSLPLLS